jgi:hypothetical protein
MRRLYSTRLALVLVLGASCASLAPKSVGPIIPEARPEQAKCRVDASQASPLVTEWPASEKANLEGMLRSGGVAVAYAGCTMRVLPQCRLRGSYVWQRTTPAADLIEINNEDELYAKLPLGAVSLEGELKRSGKLSVQTVVSGQMRLENLGVGDVPADGECARATHVVGALSVGAFTLTRGGEGTGRASANVVSYGEAKGNLTRSENRVRSAGVPDACGESTDAAPHSNCHSPIQVFLWAIPGRAAEEGPPGTVHTDFVSASANARWDVYIDDQVVCTTPCSRWVAPTRPLLLRAREDGFLMAPDKITLPSLDVSGAAGAIQLQALPTSRGELLTGITLTSFGGLGVLTGLTLTPLGCFGSEHDGFCTGGLVSLGVGGLITAGAIWLMLDALPRAQITPTLRAEGAPSGSARVQVGPGLLFGTF